MHDYGLESDAARYSGGNRRHRSAADADSYVLGPEVIVWSGFFWQRNAVLHDDGLLLCEEHYPEKYSHDRSGLLRTGDGSDLPYDFCGIPTAKSIIF